MGKLNFRRYLISRFYPTHEIRKNLMHVKKICVLQYANEYHTIAYSLPYAYKNWRLLIAVCQ